MRNILGAGCGLLMLGACVATPDDTRSGVGFGDYQDYSQTQSGAGQTPQNTTPPETVLPPARQQEDTDLEDLAETAIDEAEAEAARPATPGGNAGISDEQDFDAVADRESIESDAERLQRMQDARVEIAPTDLPERGGPSGPNIIEYALSTSHPIGQQVHRRSPFGQGRHERNCLAYRSDDLAQEAFLRMGGPERDRQALDPDGDGYACRWDPSVYRNAAAAARNQ